MTVPGLDPGIVSAIPIIQALCPPDRDRRDTSPAMTSRPPPICLDRRPDSHTWVGRGLGRALARQCLL